MIKANPLLLTLIALLLTACGGDAIDTPARTPSADGTKAAETAATREPTPSPAGARVYFVSPADGDTVTNPITVEFGIEGMTIARAGVEQAGSGHHHLIIDAGLPDTSMPIPANENYVHFGDGSTSTELTLEPGEHTLQLLLGDHLHVPHDPPVASEVITITVE